MTEPKLVSGIDLARQDAPEHAAMIEAFKEQLLLAFVRRLGGKVSIPVDEVDQTGRYVLKMNIVDRIFNFSLEKKQ